MATENPINLLSNTQLGSAQSLANAQDSTTQTEVGNTEPAAVAEEVISLVSELPRFVELLPESVQPYWQLIQKYPLLETITILFIFWLLAYLLRRYALKLIAKLADRTETNLDDDIINAVKGPIFSTVLWVGVIIAATSLQLSGGWTQYVTPIIMSIIVVIWLRVGNALSSTIFTTMSRDTRNFKKIDIRTEPLLIIASKILVFVVSAYFILVIWGINPVGLLASAGIVGIAVGFAAKDSLANLFSGVFILADRPYKLGDYINLETGERGKVTHIGIRSTRIMTRDDIEVTIPNGVIGNSKVVNETGGFHAKMRLRISLQCAYSSDLEKVNDVLMKIAEENDNVCDHPTPRVRVRGFGESGIDVELLCWVNEPELRGLVSHLLYVEIHQSFNEHGIEIPYPRREIEILKGQIE